MHYLCIIQLLSPGAQQVRHSAGVSPQVQRSHVFFLAPTKPVEQKHTHRHKSLSGWGLVQLLRRRQSTSTCNTKKTHTHIQINNNNACNMRSRPAGLLLCSLPPPVTSRVCQSRATCGTKKQQHTNMISTLYPSLCRPAAECQSHVFFWPLPTG